MDAILPAAGLAKRMRGIPKFLLPADKNYRSLLEIHIENLVDICDKIYLPTRPELVPIIKSLDFIYKNIIIKEMTTGTMCETVDKTVKYSDAESFILIMPDTLFLGDQPYKRLDPDTNFTNLACWKIRDAQRGKLGEVSIDENSLITDIVDKKPENGYAYAWGALTFNRNLTKYLNIRETTIGNTVKSGLDNGEEVVASIMEGSYYDCGTPSEYVSLLKENLI